MAKRQLAAYSRADAEKIGKSNTEKRGQSKHAAKLTNTSGARFETHY